VLNAIRFALRDLYHDRGRTMLTLLGLIVMVVSYLLLWGLAEACREYGRWPAPTRNLILLSAEVLDPMDSKIGAEAYSAVSDLPPGQVERVSPSIFRHMNIAGPVMQVRAVPPLDMEQVHSLTLLVGAWPQATDEVVATEGAMLAAGWQVGQHLVVYGSDFRLVGAVRGPGTKYASLWMTHEAGRRLLGDRRGDQMLFLKIAEGTSPEEVRTRLAADARIQGKYDVYLEDQLAERQSQAIRDLVRLPTVLLVVALLAITFGIYNATSLTLAERGWELGALRVVGFEVAVLRRFLYVRALVMVSAAYVVGSLIALAYVTEQSGNAPIVIHGAQLLMRVQPGAIVLGLALTALFAYLGVWLPLLQQLRQTVAQAIRR
jgi:hypothetical protein